MTENTGGIDGIRMMARNSLKLRSKVCLKSLLRSLAGHIVCYATDKCMGVSYTRVQARLTSMQFVQ